MNLISQIPIFGNPIVIVIAFVIVIGVVIFVHEYGHYIVGRWRGIHAETFSLGIGPVIYSRTDKRGTRWQIAAIPLGGYVKFLGDRNASSQPDHEAVAGMNAYDRRRSFPAASVFSRTLTVLAGPAANFILSIVLFAGLIMWQGFLVDQPTFGKISNLPTEVPVQEGDEIVELNGLPVASYEDLTTAMAARNGDGYMDIVVARDGTLISLNVPSFEMPLVSSIVPLSAAEKAGMMPGDFILKIGDIVPSSFSDLVTQIIKAQETEITLTVWRDGNEVIINITPEIVDVINDDGTVSQIPRLGVSGGTYFVGATETPPIWEAAWFGVERTYGTITQSLDVIGLIFAGEISPKTLQGPVGIAQISGAVVKQSVLTFISLIAIISTSIGLLNLFPIPILDGGHLLTYLYEAVRGQPPSPAFLNVFMSIGLALVLFLMVFTFYNDIMRLFSA
ncbi:MAG: RIP metalloprotease RseP [Rhodobacteraceae bacterium]|nr:RIP metalloprotease RseP [Paracoccaceae bacterium]